MYKRQGVILTTLDHGLTARQGVILTTLTPVVKVRQNLSPKRCFLSIICACINGDTKQTQDNLRSRFFNWDKIENRFRNTRFSISITFWAVFCYVCTVKFVFFPYLIIPFFPFFYIIVFNIKVIKIVLKNLKILYKIAKCRYLGFISWLYEN